MVFLVLLLVYCAGVLVGEVWSAEPPKLDVGEEVIIRTQEQDFFQLQCLGSQNITWSWTSTLPEDAAEITTREQDNTTYPFVSTFRVQGPISEDTGFYYCHYENVKNLATDKDNVASTYIYAYDGKSVWIYPDSSSLRVKTNEKLVLDCRTTLPNITATLTKGEEQVPLDIHHIRWDHRIGFEILSLTVQDGGTYKCQYQSTGEFKIIIVRVQSSSLKLQSPSIDRGPYQYFVMGEPFTLNCTLEKESADATLHWSQPNPGGMHSINTSKHGEGDNRYTVSTLHVPVASKEDSGTYTCTATASFYDPSSDSLDIEIEDDLTPFVRIERSSPEISVEEGGIMKWKAEVYSYPPNPRIVYTDWKGELLRESKRIEVIYRPSTYASWLLIHNVTGSDFGLYTLTATTTDSSATGNATTNVEVKSKPSVEVKGVPAYLRPGERLQITCVTRGFPVPSLEWELQHCPNSPPSCSEFENITGDELSLQHADPGNVVISNTSLVPKSSGFLRCLANNSLGTHNSTVPVAISDMEGVHILSYTMQNTTKEFMATTFTLITNDRILLTCGANKLLYKNVKLNIPQRFEGKVVDRETEYSWFKDIKVDKVTTVMQGEYSCVARTHDNFNQIKKVHIKVLEETMVGFLQDSNMMKNDTVHVKENAPYFLNCTVVGMPKPSMTWTKDGKPLSQDSGFFDDRTVLLSEDKQRIELKYVKGRHEGLYKCQAKNRVNTVTGRLTIVIPATGLSTGGKVGLAVALIGIAFLVITVVILIRRVKTERKFRKSFRANELYLFQKGNIGQLNPDCSADEQAELLPYGQEWEVPRNQITLGKQLGSGAFGRVVKANVTGLEGPAATTVAIKMCKSQADPSQVRALALELKIMIHLGKHLNIVNLMGANTLNIGRGELWILVEYCRFGNLLVFMHRHRRSFINQIEPTTGHIDPTKVTPETDSLLSPLSPTPSWQHSDSRRPSHEGLRSATSNKPFVLSPPPEGYLTPRSPPHPVQTPQQNTHEGLSATPNNPFVQSPPPEGYHTPRSPPPVVQTPQGHTNDRFSTTSTNPFVASSSLPGYQVPLSPPPAVVTPQVHNPLYNSTIQSPGGAGILLAPRNTDNATSGSCSDAKTSDISSSTASDGQVQNTYLTSTMGSRMSQGPSSPSEMGLLDSHGNAMVHEVGIVPGVNSPFTTTDLVCWAWQVAHGMEYLASRKVLHGDLAARNLLLGDDNVVKISDFGLSREMYKKDVYMKKSDDLMPIKWISVEAIRDRIFSVQSDVWAFGVTLWEIFSLGSTPYPGIEVNNEFLQLLENGYRMSCPKYANQEIYKLLLECWEAEPMDRPSFSDALLRLDAMLRPDIKTEYLNMNNQYMMMNEKRFKDQPDYLNMLTQPDYENMTNKGNEDDIKPQYLNMEVAGSDRRDTVGQASIQLPSEVVYCNTRNLSPDPTLPTNHYLPMDIAIVSPGLEDDVFSPRPSEDTRFNFSHHNEKTSSIDSPTKEDKPFMQDVQPEYKTSDTEHSTLITNDQGST